MEFVQAIVEKLQPYQLLILMSWLLVLTLMLLFVLLRQKRAKQLENLVLANFANVRTRIEESENKTNQTFGELLTKLTTNVDQLAEAQKQLFNTAGHTAGRVEELSNSIREAAYTMQQAVAGSGATQSREMLQALAKINENIEELTDELAWTNNWFEDIKALETAVINLVGPAKMRKLIDKERSISQAAGEELIKKSGL